MTPTEVRKLITLADHGKTRDLAIYTSACSTLDDLQAQIDALHTEIRQHSLSSEGNFNAIARWQRWAEVEINKLRSKLHNTAEEKEQARKVAVKSVAKVQTLEILLKKAQKEKLLINRRRAEQNGQPPDA